MQAEVLYGPSETIKVTRKKKGLNSWYYELTGSFKKLVPVLRQGFPSKRHLKGGLSIDCLHPHSKFDLNGKLRSYWEEGGGCKTNVHIIVEVGEEDFEKIRDEVDEVNSPKTRERRRREKKAEKDLNYSAPSGYGQNEIWRGSDFVAPVPERKRSEDPERSYRKNLIPISKNDVDFTVLSKIEIVLGGWDAYAESKQKSKERTTSRNHANTSDFFCKLEQVDDFFNMASGFVRTGPQGRARHQIDQEQASKFKRALHSYKKLCSNVKNYCEDNEFREAFEKMLFSLFDKYSFSSSEDGMLSEAEECGLLQVKETKVIMEPSTVEMIEMQLSKHIPKNEAAEKYRVKQLKKFRAVLEENPKLTLAYNRRY